MRTDLKRSPLSSIPGYGQNAVLQLIIASGVGFVMFHFTWTIIRVAGAEDSLFYNLFTVNTGLADVHHIMSKFWTIFTYGWVHNGFWELFSNMIWLYAFGSIVQMLVGYRQLIPLYVYSLAVGAIFYELSQLIPGIDLHSALYFGGIAGVISFAVAALTLSPHYRFHFTQHFSIPLVVIAIIFFALAILNTGLRVPGIALLLGGAATGFSYVKLLQNGYRPGAWVYNIFDRMNDAVTPDEYAGRNKGRRRSEVLNAVSESKQTGDEKKIDDILDKINQKGYNSLTKEEKEILMNASKGNKP